MRYFDGRFLIYDSETGFRASELTPDSLEKIGGPEAVLLKVHEATGLVLPFMKQKALVDPNNFGITKWFENMINNSDKIEMAKAGIEKRLIGEKINYTQEDVEAIVNVPLEADKRRAMAVSPKLLDYTVGDMQATTIIRRRVMVEDVPYDHPNETRNQNENTDPLGIRLPDSDIILAHIIGEPYATTPFSGTYSPYPNRLYRTKQIVNILTANSPEVRRKNIERAIETLQQVYKLDIGAAESRKLLSNFQVLPLDHVVGNPDNDTLEILPNEQDFYENLIEFIKYHIKKFNSEVMTNATEEEIAEKSRQDYNNGVLPVRLSEYLDQLLYDVLNSNFYHTGNFDYIVGDLDDSEDSSSVSAEKDGINVIMAKDDFRQSDLNVVAASYLGLSARTFGCGVWAEGIVKLMRWGDRKVKNLNVGLNNTQYLDLQTMNLVTQQLADLSQFEVQEDEFGRTLDILAATYCDFRPSDSKRAQSYPFLLVGHEYGTVPGVTEKISVTYITTLFDVVRSYEQGNPLVYDLSFVDGKFVDDYERDELLILDLEDLNNGNRKIKISEELTDYAIDNNITKMRGTAFSLMRPDEFEDYQSTEPLMERLAETPKPMRTNVVQGALSEIFQEGAENFEDNNLVNMLNWYYENVYPTHLESYLNLFGFEQEQSEGSKVNVKNIKTVHFFTESEEKEVVEEEESTKFMYPIYEGEELTFHKIVRSTKDDTLIGGYAQTADGFRVFASIDEVKEFAVSSSTVHTGQVLLNLFETMLCADAENGYTSKTKVISDRSVYNIYKAFAGK